MMKLTIVMMMMMIMMIDDDDDDDDDDYDDGDDDGDGVHIVPWLYTCFGGTCFPLGIADRRFAPPREVENLRIN